jgi:hypothetical protein
MVKPNGQYSMRHYDVFILSSTGLLMVVPSINTSSHTQMLRGPILSSNDILDCCSYKNRHLGKASQICSVTTPPIGHVVERLPVK